MLKKVEYIVQLFWISLLSPLVSNIGVVTLTRGRQSFTGGRKAFLIVMGVRLSFFYYNVCLYLRIWSISLKTFRYNNWKNKLEKRCLAFKNYAVNRSKAKRQEQDKYWIHKKKAYKGCTILKKIKSVLTVNDVLQNQSVYSNVLQFRVPQCYVDSNRST